MRFALLALFIVVAAAGCGGGGSSNTSQSTTPASGGAFTANFSFVLPTSAPAQVHRRPDYISASSRSLVVQIVYPNATLPGTVLNLNPLPASCVTTVNGTTCSVAIVAQASVRSFIVTFFDQANGQGHVLSTSTVAAPPAPDGVADINLTLDGVVATVGISLGGTLTYGRPGTVPLVITPYDADGNVITGTAPFSAPVTLTSSSTALALSTSMLTSPATVVTVTYSGTQDPTLHVTAQPQGGPPAVLAPFGPAPTAPPVLTPVPPTAPSFTLTGPETVSVQEPGYRSAYTVQSSNTNVVTVISPVTATSDTTAITIDAVGAGTANVTVTDAYNQSVVFNVTVTLTPITIQAKHRAENDR